MHRRTLLLWRRSLALGLLTAELLACTSWRVQGPTPEAAISNRKPTAVRITRIDGTRMILHRPLVRGDSLAGALSTSAATEDRAASVTIPIRDVEAVAVRRFDVLKSVGLYFAIGLALTPVFWKWP